MTKQGKILTYREVLVTVAGENGERMVEVWFFDSTLVVEYEKPGMASFTGSRIFVRESVAWKLARVNQKLASRFYTLKVVYGYRHPSVQEAYFSKQRAIIARENPSLTPDELDEETHKIVAVPSVAGHPTGGAVDVTILRGDKTPLDMGTGIADYPDREKFPTFAEGLSPIQVENRRLLHDLMLEEGFAPFYGEWWHFSYGDREWACFYGKPASLYSPIDFRI